MAGGKCRPGEGGAVSGKGGRTDKKYDKCEMLRPEIKVINLILVLIIRFCSYWKFL